MQYRTNTAITIFLCRILLVFSHLKDMGEISEWSSSLGALESKIVGGTKANLEQFPFNVQFLNNRRNCGGIILTSKTLMTAAHCFNSNKNVAEMKVYSSWVKQLGKQQLKFPYYHYSRFMFDLKSTRHDVWDFVIHEKYKKPLIFSNDIAVIIIHDTFKFGPTVQKAYLCNNDTWMNEKERSFIASGWGRTEFGKKNSKGQQLLQTHLRYISPKKCAKMSHASLSRDMFCLHGDGKRDTCQGDSGGGILWNGMIVGIVSHGKNCAKVPGVYTNVYYMKAWIQRTVHKLHSKFCSFHNDRTNKGHGLVLF